MDDKYFREQAARVRAIADTADPFTKKRLLALAERYDAGKSSPRAATIPSSGVKPSTTKTTSALAARSNLIDTGEGR